MVMHSLGMCVCVSCMHLWEGFYILLAFVKFVSRVCVRMIIACDVSSVVTLPFLLNAIERVLPDATLV